MGYVDVQKLSCVLPDGRVLFDEVSFRVGDGAKTALVGANGTGKTTLLKLIAGDLTPSDGAVARDGGLGVLRQFLGSVRGGRQGGAAEAARRRPDAVRRRGGARRRPRRDAAVHRLDPRRHERPRPA